MTSPSENALKRPLSPHLQVYRPQVTSVLSITHRITGVILSVAIAVMVAWLTALAGGQESYNQFLQLARSVPGQVVLMGISWAFFFHLCLGVRHLFWDAGQLLEIKQVYKSGYIAITVAALLTAAVWMQIYGVSL